MFVRRVIVLLVCLAIAWLGVSGLHGHRAVDGGAVHPSDHVEAAGHSHDSAVPQFVSSLDTHHLHQHTDHKQVDIDPPTKAFAKLSLLKVFFAVLVAFGIFLLAIPTHFALRAFMPRPRPPKPGWGAYILPPSHAPPAVAL